MRFNAPLLANVLFAIFFAKMKLPIIGYGTFKLGRNQGAKYKEAYPLPSLKEAEVIIDFLLQNNVNFFDTAPAYGIAEQQLGNSIKNLGIERSNLILASKFGEYFENGKSFYDFNKDTIFKSVENSLKSLNTDYLDLLSLHAHYPDLELAKSEEIISALSDLKRQGLIKYCGFSGYTNEAFTACHDFYDYIMLEYHPEYLLLEPSLETWKDKSVIVKKALGAGKLAPKEAFEFILKQKSISSILISSLNLKHLEENINLIRNCLEQRI